VSSSLGKEACAVETVCVLCEEEEIENVGMTCEAMLLRRRCPCNNIPKVSIQW
jgi:hypothetical protein